MGTKKAQTTDSNLHCMIFQFTTFKPQNMTLNKSYLSTHSYKRNQVISTYISDEKCKRSNTHIKIMKPHSFRGNIFLDESFIYPGFAFFPPQILIVKQSFLLQWCVQEAYVSSSIMLGRLQDEMLLCVLRMWVILISTALEITFSFPPLLYPKNNNVFHKNTPALQKGL